MITSKNQLRPVGNPLSAFSNKTQVLKNLNGPNMISKQPINKIASQASIKTKNDKLDGASTKTLQEIWQ